MIKQFLTLVIFISLTSAVSATTFTVNNNAPSPGQYTTIGAAMSAAANGDTILVNGSLTTYSIGANISKALTILGTGHAPVKDNPLITKISFAGFFINTSNVTIKGVVLEGGTQILGSNVTISECKFLDEVYIFNITGLVLRNNIFSAPALGALYFTAQNSSVNANIIIENNLFTSGAQIYQPNLSKGVTVRNNVFLGSSTSPLNMISLGGISDNWIFQNNIFWNVTVAPSTTNSAFINNISYSPNGDANVPITNGGLNVGNINADPQFFSYGGGGIAPGQNLRLQSGSPGFLAGTDGTDIGMYGTLTPHTDHGMPNIPVMQSMNITGGSVPVGGVIQVTFQSHIQN